MAHPPETRQAIRQAYIFARLDLEAAAAKHGVGYATARRWKTQAAATGDDWDKARAVTSMSANSTATVAQLVLADFLANYQSTMEALRDAEIPALDKAEALSRMADAFTKTMAAVAKASPDMARFAVANELLQDLAAFVRDHQPEHLQAIVDILDPFAVFVAKKYG